MCNESFNTNCKNFAKANNEQKNNLAIVRRWFFFTFLLLQTFTTSSHRSTYNLSRQNQQGFCAEKLMVYVVCISPPFLLSFWRQLHYQRRSLWKNWRRKLFDTNTQWKVSLLFLYCFTSSCFVFVLVQFCYKYCVPGKIYKTHFQFQYIYLLDLGTWDKQTHHINTNNKKFAASNIREMNSSYTKV